MRFIEKTLGLTQTSGTKMNEFNAYAFIESFYSKFC